MAALAALVLCTTALRPLGTDDFWWHLALGEAFAEGGLHLDDDPLVFTAPGPPVPAAWLADWSLAALTDFAGFDAVRVLHALLVVAVLLTAARVLRRAGAGLEAGALALLVFIGCGAYRLFQLRPELATILISLWLVGVIANGAPRWRWGNGLHVFAVTALWSNLHPGFLLGPALIGVALGSQLLAMPLRPSSRTQDLPRLGALAGMLVAALTGSLLNPVGIDAYLPLLIAGTEKPPMGIVGDEWSALPVFALPAGLAGLFPWLVWWLLLLATLGLAQRALPRWCRGDTEGLDPALVGLAVAGLFLMASAVRFQWLAFLPLLLIVSAQRHARIPRIAFAAVALPAAALLLNSADGKRVAGELPESVAEYRPAYPAARYFAHSTWLMDDAGLKGRLFADYFLGGFHGYWLAPRIRSFVNGSLNATPRVMQSNFALRTRGGAGTADDFLTLLDHWEIDLYLGTRLPEEGPVGRPWYSTTSDLEGEPGWRLIFRNLRSALYLRMNARNADNLARITTRYHALGVPFDPARGFEVARVIREAPDFAVRYGVLPQHFARLARARDRGRDATRRAAADRLASIYAVLGLYEQALDVGAEAQGSLAARREVWALLRLGRAREAARILGAQPRPLQPARVWDPLIRATEAATPGAMPSRKIARDALDLPFLTRLEGVQVLQGFESPALRPPRSERPPHTPDA